MSHRLSIQTGEAAPGSVAAGRLSKASAAPRAHYVKWCREMRRVGEQCEVLSADGSEDPVDIQWPPFPESARGLACGAKTRAGTPCRRRDLSSNGRCKLHGGLSTGPRTAAGRARAIANLMVRWRHRTP